MTTREDARARAAKAAGDIVNVIAAAGGLAPEDVLLRIGLEVEAIVLEAIDPEITQRMRLPSGVRKKGD